MTTNKESDFYSGMSNMMYFGNAFLVAFLFMHFKETAWAVFSFVGFFSVGVYMTFFNNKKSRRKK